METTPDRVMSLRFAGVCTACGEKIPRGAQAMYSPSTKSVRHVCCPSEDRGNAGGSAMREFERRSRRDAARVQEKTEQVQKLFGQGMVGRIATRIAVDDTPRRSTAVWHQGAVGEEIVAASLDALSGEGIGTLHDRRIPRTRANIDHIAVTPWGVWVIDTKRYLGQRPDVYVEGGILGLGGIPRLKVGGRKRDHLVEGVLHQCSLVRAELSSTVPVFGALCFVGAEWPLIGGDFAIRGIQVCWPKRLAQVLLRKTAPIIDVEAERRLLAVRFPSA